MIAFEHPPMPAHPALIHQPATALRRPPQLSAAARAAFSWEQLRAGLDGLPGGGLNIAHEAVDRHAAGPRAGRTALRFLDGSRVRDLTYAELSRLSARFCNLLRGLGVRPGERVFVLSGRVPELYVAVLGALKNGNVVSPLFAAFGPEPLATRLRLGEASVLVTTTSQYRRKLEPQRSALPQLRHVLLIEDEDGPLPPDTLPLAGLMAAAAERCELHRTGAADAALLHFTSGTTGTPKGALHVHGAAVMHYMTGLYALDLHDDDIYWCTADPGWVTGTSYGIIAPLLHGVTSIVDTAEFDAERWYRILGEQQVSVWYTAPTAIRMLMRSGAALARQFAHPALRLVASVGEPLNPEAIWWAMEALGLPIHDNWWQTETGGIMIANTPGVDIKPGSMGKPLPGVEAAIVQRQEDGSLEFIDDPQRQGELALRSGWPSMFRTYLGQDERYRKCFAGDWYLSGDLARRDADGYYWFVGRADDVIKSAGHLIGPFEVESALMEHAAVAEAGVIGKPDPVLGEMVKAFVSLKAGYEPGPALQRELLGHARRRLGAAVAPKELEFRPVLPRTRSGKIMRRLLRARELGLPEGDLSMLEGGA